MNLVENGGYRHQTSVNPELCSTTDTDKYHTGWPVAAFFQLLYSFLELVQIIANLIRD